jgi:hypothetical protein
MRALTRFATCLGIIAAPLLFIPSTYAATGDDNLVIAAGVPGAPVGGTTGTGGNGGVGDMPAGEDRTQSYDAPSSSSPSMDDQTRHHEPRYNANDPNNSNQSGQNPGENSPSNPNAGNGLPPNGSNTY